MSKQEMPPLVLRDADFSSPASLGKAVHKLIEAGYSSKQVSLLASRRQKEMRRIIENIFTEPNPTIKETEPTIKEAGLYWDSREAQKQKELILALSEQLFHLQVDKNKALADFEDKNSIGFFQSRKKQSLQTEINTLTKFLKLLNNKEPKDTHKLTTLEQSILFKNDIGKIISLPCYKHIINATLNKSQAMVLGK